MKFSDLNLLPLRPRVLRKSNAENYVGGETNLVSLIKAGWVKPLVQGNRNTSFDIQELDFAIDRAKVEGWPKGKTI